MKHNTLKKIVPAALVAAAAGFAIAKAQEGPSSNPAELHQQAVQLLDRDTSCYDFGENPTLELKTVTDETGNQRRVLTVPLRDATTHGKDRWQNADASNFTNLINSGFVAEYTTFGGQPAGAKPLFGQVHAAEGTTPQSTAYDIDVYIPTSNRATGENTVNIYYAADVALSDSSKPEKQQDSFLRGTRLCGTVDFIVNADGSVSNAHALPPSEEVGKLHVAVNNPETDPAIG